MTLSSNDPTNIEDLLHELKTLVLRGFETVNHNIDRLEDRVDRLEARIDSSDNAPFYEH